MAHLEKLVQSRIPNSPMKADPHIESRVKTLKKQYHVILEMLQASGFGWDDTEKCMTTTKDVFDDWCNVIAFNLV